MKTPCWSCHGQGQDSFGPCEFCDATGFQDEPRLQVMVRRKQFVGRQHPDSDANGNEKWPRMTVEVPPEVAEELDRIAKQLWRGHSVNPPKRSSIVRAALIEWMDRHDPESEVIEATSEEIFERLELEQGPENSAS